MIERDRRLFELETRGDIVQAGSGNFRVLREFSGLEYNETIAGHDILRIIDEKVKEEKKKPPKKDRRRIIKRYKIGPMNIYTRYADDACNVCGTVSLERCENGHCMICVGKSTCGAGKCYCGNCLECYGWAGGNECNVCSD